MDTEDRDCRCRSHMALAVSGCVAAAAALHSPSARAAFDFNPEAQVSALYDTNVFARPDDEPPFAARGNTQLGDFVTRYLIGATADLDLGFNTLILSAQGSRYQFDRFTELNHYESRYAGAFDWHLGPLLDGSLAYTQNRIMAPLADNLAEALEIQTERSASALVRLQLTPRWRLDVQPSWHDFESPLPLYPEFGFKESGVSGSINYLGIGKLTAGLRGAYLSGSFHHIAGATRYHQYSTDLTANYAVTGLSSFDGEAGFTTRDSALANAADAAGPFGGPGGANGKLTTFTGSLGFKRELSVKTSVTLRVFRDVNSYVSGANSEVGTGGEAGVKWAPTLKLSLTLRYRMSNESVQGAVAISGLQSRSDKLKHAELGSDYAVVHWLTVHPYAFYDKRKSNVHQATYSATSVGIDFTAQLHPPKK